VSESLIESWNIDSASALVGGGKGAGIRNEQEAETGANYTHSILKMKKVLY